MNSVKVRLAQWLEGEQTEVLANIYPLGRRRATAPGSPQIRNAAIPAGNFPDQTHDWTTFQLPRGRYLVEAILPSGETVEQEIELPGESGVQIVELKGPPSPHEWLSWQSFVESPPILADAVKAVFSDEAGRRAHPRAQFVRFRPETAASPDPVPRSLVDWQTLAALVDSPAEPAAEEMANLLAHLQLSGGAILPLVPSQGDSSLILHHADSTGPAGFNRSPRWNPLTQFQPDTPRFLAVVSLDATIREIAVLPIPWMRVDHTGEAMVELVLPNEAGARPADPGQSGAPGDFLSGITVRDQLMGNILGYFSSGDLPRAAILAGRQQPMELLYEKMANPLAAAAGAYILIAGQQTGQMTRATWHDWVRNLMNWFPTLPDGAILYGWLKLREGDLEASRNAFLTALQRGLPFYSMGVRWLLDGLTVLLTDAKSRKTRYKDLSQSLNAVRTVARHTNVTQPFTAVRIGVRRPDPPPVG